MTDPTLPSDPAPASRTEPPPSRPIRLAPTYPALVDAWPWARPFLLNGGVERGQFHPLGAAALVFVGAFVLFQGIGAVAMGIGLAIRMAQADDFSMDIETLLVENGDVVLVGNTIGQWLGFALLAALMARWSTPDWKEFLRARRPDWAGLGLAALGWAAFYPLVLWLGELNKSLPLPEWAREMDVQQGDAMEMLLMGAELPTWFLFIAVAITPAVCEELMFRGYLQRQVERGLGLGWSIGLVGVLFGAYHLQPSNLLPLSALGVYLGFVVWATGSVWTGTLVHFLNNGIAVLMVAYARTRPDLDLEAIEAAGIPWYFPVVGLIFTPPLVYGLLRRRRQVVGDTPDAAPVEPDDSFALSTASSPAHV